MKSIFYLLALLLASLSAKSQQDSFQINKLSSICYDTASRFYLENDTIKYFVYDPTRTADGNILLSGSYFKRGTSKGGAFLLKCDDDGNIIWHQHYDSANAVGNNFTGLILNQELSDGTILAAGFTDYQPTQNNDIIVFRLDATGNIIWKKMFYSIYWGPGNGSAGYFNLHSIKQDPQNGDIYFVGSHWGDGKALAKLDLATGNILWSRAYKLTEAVFHNPFGIDIRPGEIRYWSKDYAYGHSDITVVRINKQTGDTIATKAFRTTATNYYDVEFLGAGNATTLNNGHTMLDGTVFGYWKYQWNGVTPLYHAALVEFDENLNYVQGWVYRSPVESDNGKTKFSVFQDGTATLNYRVSYSAYVNDEYFIQLNNGQILKKRVKRNIDNGTPLEPKNLPLPGGGHMSIKQVIDSTTYSDRIEVTKRYISDTASSCMGYNDTLTFAEPIHYGVQYKSYYGIPQNIFQEHISKTYRQTNFNRFTKTPGCFQVSNCDTLWLSVSPAVTCPGVPVTVQVHKNAGCGTEVPLQYDTTNVESVTRVNDSTYTFIFNNTWNNYIRASLMGCTLHMDSVQIQVSSAATAVNLGPDTTICPSNTIVLNAGAGFSSYMWQDGSSNPTFTVTQPGIYYVTAQNSCDGVFSDTVHILPRASVSVSIGPDRTKCNADTIQFHAPTGHLSYNWSPAYYITATTGQHVVVNPPLDTVYTVKIEVSPGCFSYDTVRVAVFHSPPIQLGPDKSVCQGDQITLNGGAGFNNYLWSTGETTQQINVSNAGAYSLIGITNAGCKSYDTLVVLNVFALPRPVLDRGAILCEGTTKTLTPGQGFSQYSWNTGANTESITVNSIGQYFVEVIDNNGCKASDTTYITQILQNPSFFLPQDILICQYESATLSPTSNYISYLWNTGSSASTLITNNPGTYWLQVTDINGCKGIDSIQVKQKNGCITGVHVPSAFSPNNDGKNDIFKPITYEKIVQYSFLILNRWGEVIFSSNNPLNGWDGKVKGIKQDTGIFVWSLSYQIEGQNLQKTKGAVLLIR